MASTSIFKTVPKPAKRTTKDNHYQNGWKTLWSQAVSAFNPQSLIYNTSPKKYNTPVTPNKYSTAIKKTPFGLRGITLLKEGESSHSTFQQPQVKTLSKGTSSGSGSSSGGGGSSSSSSTSSQDDAKYKGSALPDSSKERDYYYNPHIYSRKDSRFKEQIEQSTYYIEGFNEAIAVESYPDGLIHRYFTAMSIDSDKNDIVTTATLNCPYSQQLMKYWIPGQQSISIYGGTFDKELLFRGRLREVSQNGYEIILTFENVAWKLKQNISSKLYKELEGKEVEYAVKRIFKEAGIKYHVNLSGIPNISNYKLDEECSVKLNDDTVESIPELTDVIKSLESSNMYNDYATQTDDIITVSEKHAEQEMKKLDNILGNQNKHKRNKLRTNWTLHDNINLKDTKKIHDPEELQKLSDDLLGKPHYPQEDDTYFDVLSSIASAIDAHMYMVKDTCYFISFPVLFLMDREESGLEEEPLLIDFWMQEDDSFEFDVNQYGFYTTVIVNYRHGSVIAENEDLVRVYGQMPIVYDEPKLTKTQAEAKAQAYLSAHIRDFAMTIKVTVLHTGKIQVGSFIKLRNPQTMSENLYYVYGISTSWDGNNGTFKSDLDLRYGPENPDNPEIPEYGVQAVSGDDINGQTPTFNTANGQPQSVQQAAQEAIKSSNPLDAAAEAAMWVASHITYQCYADFHRPPECVLSAGYANCSDGSRLVAAMCACFNIYIDLVWIHGFDHKTGKMAGHVFNRVGSTDIDWCRFEFFGIKKSNIGLNTHSGGGVPQKSQTTYPKLPPLPNVANRSCSGK